MVPAAPEGTSKAKAVRREDPNPVAHQEESAQSSAPADPMADLHQLARLCRSLFPGQVPSVDQLGSSQPLGDTLKEWACHDFTQGLQAYSFWEQLTQKGSSSNNLSFADISNLAQKNKEQRMALNLARDSLREAEGKVKAAEGGKAVARNKLKQAIDENTALKERVKELEDCL